MGEWLLRRALPLAAVALACAFVAFGIAKALPDNQTAEAIVVVPSGGTRGLSPGEAANLAATYANLIPEDRVIVARLARSLGLDPAGVRKSLRVTHDFATSVLRLRYVDRDPEVALAGSRLLAQSVSGPAPVSPRIAPRSLSVVALPTETTSDSLEPAQAAVLGLLLGLVVGGVLLLAWRRAFPRIEDINAFGAEVGCASSSLEHASDDSIAALVDRWIDLAGTSTARVALLPVAAASEKVVEGVAERIVRAAPHAQRAGVPREGAKSSRSSQVTLEVGGAVGGPAAGEALTRSVDLTVLVVAEGTRFQDLRDALWVLYQFGAKPDWALLVGRSLPSEILEAERSRRRAAVSGQESADGRDAEDSTVPPGPATRRRVRGRSPQREEAPPKRRAAGEPRVLYPAPLADDQQQRRVAD